MDKKKTPSLTPAQIRKAIVGQRPSAVTSTLKSVVKQERPHKVVRNLLQPDLSLLLTTPYTICQCATQYPTPDWFTSKEKVDVSVIVPIYKAIPSRLVESWDFSNDGRKVEIIFVDDNCPFHSKEKIVDCFTSRRDEISKPFAKIIQSEITQGWGGSCNIGAMFAKGDTLIFLHPESKLSPGWISSMVRLLRKKDVGIVGGMQIHERVDELIDAGQQWQWKSGEMLPVGHDLYRGKEISKPFQLDNMPSDLFYAAEREAVNGQCMAIRKKDFQDIGGFHSQLYHQAWSDADLCCAIRERGLKILYQPSVRVYHEKLIAETKYEANGRAIFHNKWVASKRLNSLVSDQPTEPSADVKNVLVRRQAAHGDVLIAAAIVPAIKKKYPNCNVFFWTDCPEVLVGNPWIDKLVADPAEVQFNLYINLDMVYEYRPYTNILTAYAEEAGVSVDDCRLFLETKEMELPEKYVAIHAGKTMWAGRNWSTVKFDQISTKLAQSGYKVVSVGTISDHKVANADLDLRGKTDVGQLASVIKNARMFIGIDSFPMHVAQAFDVPGVAFFGSVIPETRLISKAMTSIKADGVKCLGCHHRKPTPCTSTSVCEVGIQECINLTTVQMMWRAIERLLENTDN